MVKMKYYWCVKCQMSNNHIRRRRKRQRKNQNQNKNNKKKYTNVQCLRL